MILSAIVPCHNVEGYLDRCLSSLRDQDLGPEEYQIIVIDDGSTDGSLLIAREHEAHDPRISVHHQSNQGVSAARNAGLDLATGDYVWFVDGDDYVAGDSLRPMVQVMRELSLDLLWFGWHFVRPDEDVINLRLGTGMARSIDVTNGIDYLTERLDYPTSAWSFLLDRSFLVRAGVRFEVGRFFEDQLFPVELLALAGRVASLGQDVYRCVIRPGSITRNSDPEHVRRLFGDLEHVVLGLEDLRQRTVAAGKATPAFLDRLTNMQEGYIFLIIAKVIRSRVPLRPVLPDTLARLRATGLYPLTHFPDRDHSGLRYRILARVFNHRPLLYPLAYLYRVGAVVRRRLSKGGLPIH